MERRGREKEVCKAQASIPPSSLGAGWFRSLVMVPGVQGRELWDPPTSSPRPPCSPGHLPPVDFLFTAQGSFLCSNDEIISGLDMQSPKCVRRQAQVSPWGGR